jgi:hypothetical protein
VTVLGGGRADRIVRLTAINDRDAVGQHAARS